MVRYRTFQLRSLSQHLRTQMDEASPAQISTVVNRYARANLADEAKVFIPRTMRLLSDMDSKQLSGVQSLVEKFDIEPFSDSSDK